MDSRYSAISGENMVSRYPRKSSMLSKNPTVGQLPSSVSNIPVYRAYIHPNWTEFHSFRAVS